MDESSFSGRGRRVRVEGNPFRKLVFEISGVCNAKCPFCLTGSRRMPPGGFVDLDLFRKSIKRLMDEGLIDSQTKVYLFNWGEPLLHPHFREIVECLNDYDLRYVVSTNGSVFLSFSKAILRNLSRLAFSMPGFSQASYDRIHKLNFEEIKRNIQHYVSDLKSLGYAKDIRILFHIYQFNLDELAQCESFSRSLQITFAPYEAYLNDYWLIKNYLGGNLSAAELKEIAESLLAYKLREIPHRNAGDYECPQHRMLALDEKANVITCCVLPRNHPDYSCGDLHAGSLEAVLKNKTSKSECEWCVKSGVSHYVHNTEVPGYLKSFFHSRKDGMLRRASAAVRGIFPK
jgi:MoaA/NifB/PqqE/SkfB family radical SAM enzyme